MLRLLDGTEPAATRVATLLDNQRPVMSWVNLGEVFYVIRREHGEDEATDADLWTADPELLIENPPWRWTVLRSASSVVASRGGTGDDVHAAETADLIVDGRRMIPCPRCPTASVRS